jgi:hypothetical protein
VKTLHARALGIDELVENQEQLKGLHRPGIEVVVSVLAVVEMEPAELSELNQARDDQLDVHVRRMMSEIDQRPRAIAELAGAVVARAPVVETVE